MTTEKTRFPNQVRDANSQSKNKSKKQYLSTMSKIVYLFIVKEKFRDPKFSPSYVYMSRFYGVARGSYGRSLRNLESFGAIKTELKSYKNTGVLEISLVDDVLLGGNFELIPSMILTTDVYTLDQKLFIAMLWKMFYKKALGNKEVSMHVMMSDNTIVKEMTPLGFSRVVTLRMLRELSDTDCGCIPILNKAKKGYELNTYAISAIADREIHRWRMAKMVGKKSQGSYPIYEKPLPFDFKYIETEEGAYIVENRQERIAPIIKKLTNACETFEEAKARFEKEQEEYED